MQNENWIDKCLKCKHSYTTREDDYLKCRLKQCRFEECRTKKMNSPYKGGTENGTGVNK